LQLDKPDTLGGRHDMTLLLFLLMVIIARWWWVAQRQARRIAPGTRVYVSGGYDTPPRWLSGARGYAGVVTSFIAGQNVLPAMVVRLDQAITVDGLSGDYVVLELRHSATVWSEGAIAQVELCDFIPENKRWQERRQGTWVESHAQISREK
jgi:hypothetical protein